MASQTKSQLQSENARLEAENAALRAAVHKPRIPSASLCRAILAAPPAIQRKLYIERLGIDFPTTVDVELWLEEMREALGLV